MTYCHEVGLPHSTFLSWDPNDRAKTIAYALERAERCTSCGTSSWEWEADMNAYIAVRQQCPGCLRRESVMEDTQDPPKGSSVVLIPKAKAEAVARDPKSHVIDSVDKRRARRQAAEAQRLATEGEQ
jgi:hypothetical protein